MKKAIIRINVNLPAETMKAIAERARKEWNDNGIVILGPWCDVYVVDDAELDGGGES